VKSGNNYQAVKKQVKTGRTYNGKIEIAEGLSEGDVVITSGLYSMKAGDVIAL
jgi:multidrug efflux pump subunit AcrA (membrane-fusion protein)